MAMLLLPLLFLAVVLGAMFGSAGRWDLPWFWAMIGVQVAIFGLAGRLVDPGLRKERLRPGPGGQDRPLRFIVIPFLLCHLIVAGLDVGRFQWSGSVPLAVHVGGFVGYAGGLGLTVWAVVVNRFYSPVVRIQHERGHRLITAGPYQYVRHPGYTGTMLSLLGSGLMLGSWWSLVPYVCLYPLIIRRVIIEDRFLCANLDGYAEYAAKVRRGLLPGIW